MMLSEVAVEPKVPKPAKAAKQPEHTALPPKEEPEKKGTTSDCADSFIQLTSFCLLFLLLGSYTHLHFLCRFFL